ncbi:hypothetical protein NW768_010970 [Fusarium equiseti]|uniref:EKC/KEOPS complex subunit BUD32 n=1 Tax=Fusarium equiseti TaxID=61235 RepID=A0ABQ8QZ75_FUSEQ|nr:hypothetical protein NW768_010970 [Fusarium equiseti]
MKLFKEDSRDRITREIEVLQLLRSGPNMIDMVDVVQGEEGANIGIVLEYVNNTDFRTLYPRFTDFDIRYYTREILKALEFAHGQGIMHRDVRPHNVVIDHQQKKLRLIGWSSAEFYQPGTEYDGCIGLNKPPEVLLGYEKYDCSVDMWCFGNMLAAMIFRKEPFFHGISLTDQLVNIAKVLGSDRIYEFVEQYEITMFPEDREALGHRDEEPWESFKNEGNRHLATMEAISFVDRLLRVDPAERLTASEALSHFYYAGLDSRATGWF